MGREFRTNENGDGNGGVRVDGYQPENLTSMDMPDPCGRAYATSEVATSPVDVPPRDRRRRMRLLQRTQYPFPSTRSGDDSQW